MLDMSVLRKAEEHYREMQQEVWGEAEKRRLLHGAERPARWHCRALRALGRRLVIWGSQLESRYAVATPRVHGPGTVGSPTTAS